MSNDIKVLLDIQDENIYFENNSTENKEFKGKTSKFITGTLTYQPSGCENCGVKNENYIIYKNGTRSEEHTSELQSRFDIVCRLLLEKKKRYNQQMQGKTSKHI